jgi:hypothetical protein
MNGRSGPKVMVSRACSSSHSTRPKRCCVGRQTSRCSPSGSSSVIHATKSSSSVPEGKTAERQRMRRVEAFGRRSSRWIWAFVADLALRGSDHVPLIQDDEADVIQHRRIGSKSEVQLLRCGHDNLAGAKRFSSSTSLTPMLP